MFLVEIRLELHQVVSRMIQVYNKKVTQLKIKDSDNQNNHVIKSSNEAMLNTDDSTTVPTDKLLVVAVLVLTSITIAKKVLL